MTFLWIWANDLVPFTLFCLFIYYLYSTSSRVSWGWWEKEINIPIDPNNKKRANLYKKIDKEQLQIENLVIKYEEIKNEIDKLNFESSSDLEIESENNLKVRKLELQLKHLDIKIEEKRNLINHINNEIQWIM